MPTMVWDQHWVAEALRTKGETTSEPLLGLETVTLARAGAAHTSSARRAEPQIRIGEIDRRFFRGAQSAGKISLAGVHSHRYPSDGNNSDSLLI